MKPHRPEYAEIDDPEHMCIVLGFRCRACSSQVTASFSLQSQFTRKLETPEGKRAKENLKEKLMGRFRSDFPDDCEEARNLNICKQVHDS